MKVVVVGGGVVGLSCAWALARRGAEVTIVERDRCGEATSRGNGGWIVPALSAPLAAPGAMAHALRWAWQPDSPFLIRPRFDLAFLRWCWYFWRSSDQRQYERGLRAMVRLNKRTIELYDELKDEGVAFEMHADGLLFVARTRAGLAEYTDTLGQLVDAGYAGELEQLDAEALLAREPALADGVIGGIHAKAERHVRPETVVHGLTDALRDGGVHLVEHAPVERLKRGNGCWQLETREGSHAADRVVVATGVWTRAMLRLVGVELPLQGAKGYSVTAVGRGSAPRHALYLTETKVGCSPFTDGMRVAGTLELAGLDLSLNQRRLGALTRATSTYLKDWEPAELELEWAGLRPLLPDGLPAIGAVPGCDGLFVATGHGMVGVTLAPATAAALAPLVLENRSPPELEPFSPARFDRGRS